MSPVILNNAVPVEWSLLYTDYTPTGTYRNLMTWTHVGLSGLIPAAAASNILLIVFKFEMIEAEVSGVTNV